MEISTVGIILMVCGGIGLLISLLWATAWGHRAEPGQRTVIREREVYPPDREIYRS